MISLVRIRNFQSHQNTEIVFEKGVNIIKGQSHSGKSVLIRALLWCFTANLRGDGFRSHFLKKGVTSVEVEFTDGTFIGKYKTAMKTEYVLVRNEEKTTYTAMGGKVPPEITEVIGIPPCALQTQFAGHFLLNESSGAVARTLNSVVGLDVISVITKKANEFYSKKTVSIAQREEKVKEFIEVLKKYEYAPEFISQVRTLRIQYNALLASKQDAEYIREAIINISEYNKALSQCSRIVSLQSRIESVLELYAEYVQCRKKRQELHELTSQIATYDKNVKELSKYPKYWATARKINTLVDSYNQKVNYCIELESLVDDYTECTKKLNDITQILDTLQQKVKNTESLLTEYDALVEKCYVILDIVEELNKIDTKYKKIIQVIEQTKEELGGICPLCGNAFANEEYNETTNNR